MLHKCLKMTGLLAGMLILCITAPFPGCSASAQIFEVPQKITGEIMVVGNHPFTKLALRAEEGRVYIITGSREIESSLLSHQGRIADVFYDRLEEKNGGYEIRVVRFEIHSK